MTVPAPSYVIDRVGPPRWLTSGAEIDQDLLYEFTGEQAEWGWAIPHLYQVLSSPSTNRPFPRPPSDDSHDVALAYWSALLHLLIYSFGWARADRGMRWWYDAGKPVDDPRLRLIRDVWDSDGQLDWFVSWLWTTHWLADIGALEAISGHAVDRGRVPVDQIWLDRVLAASSSTGIASPAPAGGSDPLHLSSVLEGCFAKKSWVNGEFSRRSRVRPVLSTNIGGTPWHVEDDRPSRST